MKLDKIKIERLELAAVEQKKRIVDLEDEQQSMIEVLTFVIVCMYVLQQLRCAQSSKLHGDERIRQMQTQLDINMAEHSEHVRTLKQQFDEEVR